MLEKDYTKQIIELYNKGLSSAKVAEQIPVSPTQIRRILNKNNIKARSNKTDNNLECIIYDRYIKGESSEKIAKELGMNGTTICRIIKRLGGEIRTNKGNKRIYKIRSDSIKNIDLENKDHCITLSHHKKDEECIVKLINYIYSGNNIKPNDIIKMNEQRLTSKYLSSLNRNDKINICNFLFSYFRRSGFPYESFDKQSLIKDFNRLKKSNCVLDNNKIISIDNSGLKIFRNFCNHYFTVRSKYLPSMVDAFNDDNRLMNVINNRVGLDGGECFNITGNMLRQGFRNSYQSFAASIFKPSIAKFFYDTYASNNSTVLDISSGFGQRLLGAMASDKVYKYIGFDPWVETYTALNNIIEFFNFNACMYNIGSELIDLPSDSVDFCFSSPPFFDKEIYCTSKSQAYNGKTFDKFVDEWWVVTCLNVYKALKNNCYFVLNMNEEMSKEMLEKVGHLFKLENTLHIDYQRAHKGKSASDLFFVLKKL